MCLAKPLLVSRIDGEIAWVGEGGRERPISLLGVAGVVPGDYILAHAGIALMRLEPQEAQNILIVLEGLTAADDGDSVTE
jgi:hydrogenase expression/formation protein HypC